MNRHNISANRQRGFSLLEMLVVVAILAIISAGILSQMDQAQQRASSEQVKLDNFQAARDFVDQLFRDLSQAGYPNSRMVDNTTAWLANPITNDNRLAVGLVRINTNEIVFEGDVNGDGNVESVRYTINGNGACPTCLQRSEVVKTTNTPLNQGTNWGTAADNVDTANPDPIFTYFQADGTQVPAASLPLDINSAPNTIAAIKTIQIRLTVRNDNIVDSKTRQAIETTFQGLLALNNCSMAPTTAAPTPAMSCN
jgi:prepilin-type N-terminal cleavage/methylation domain-containing protein